VEFTGQDSEIVAEIVSEGAKVSEMRDGVSLELLVKAAVSCNVFSVSVLKGDGVSAGDAVIRDTVEDAENVFR
jgi:hypothetical protein